MTVYYGTFRVRKGMRDAYIKALTDADLETKFRKQPGCLFYSLAASITDPDVLVACDGWEDRQAFNGHLESEDCKVWYRLFDQYVEETIRSETMEVSNSIL